MRIVSRVIHEPFWKYNLLEQVLLSITAAAAVPVLLLWVMMKTRRSDLSNNLLDVVRDQGPVLVVAAVFAIAIINVVNWFTRRTSFVVSAEVTADGSGLRMELRRNSAKTIHAQLVPMNELRWVKYKSPALPFMTSYSGYQFFSGTGSCGVLLTDHFIWEDQKRRVKDFLTVLNKHRPLDGRTFS